MAGQEPEKTNELLQVIGMAIQNKVDSKKAVEEWRIKQSSNGKPKKPASKAAPKDKMEKKSPPPETIVPDKVADDLEKKPRVDSGIVEDGVATTPHDEMFVETTKIESPVKVPEEPLIKEPLPVEATSSADPATEIKTPLTQSPPEPNPNAPSSPPKPAAVDENQDLINIIDEEAANRRKKKPLTSRKSTSDKLLKQQPSQEVLDPQVAIPAAPPSGEQSKPIPKETNGKSHPPLTRPRTSLRPPSVRPASARPGAPRKRDRNVEVVVVQANENLQLGDINVKVEQFKTTSGSTFDQDDNDDENLIVIEDINIQDTLLQKAQLEAQSLQVADDEGNQGQLVKQIRETQKEFEATGDGPRSETLLAKSSTVVSELRDQIQKLTKSIQPLGKFMDFLLEDIDSMQREHEMWRERGKEVALKLAREKNSTEGTVQSLRHQLEELGFELQEKQSALFTVRESILQNEERILKLFKNF